MTEVSAIYCVSDHLNEPRPETLLPFTDTGFNPPDWQDVRILIQGLRWTGSQVADFVGVNSRTVRKWTSPPSASNHAPIPYAVWRLLLIAAGKVTAITREEH